MCFVKVDLSQRRDFALHLVIVRADLNEVRMRKAALSFPLFSISEKSSAVPPHFPDISRRCPRR
ncbi:MAG: hypothetical protein U0559_19615 [Anaerolineae bacterium]